MPASQVDVGCPWARGLQPQLHPKAEEHPQAYQPATQSQALSNDDGNINENGKKQ